MRLVTAALVMLIAAPLLARERQDDLTEPVAAAILAAYKDYGAYLASRDPAAGEAPALLSLCIDTAVPLNYPLLARRVAAGHLRPVPVQACSGNIAIDPNPLVGRYTRWSDEAGQAADGLSVASAECRFRPRCTIDIDMRSNGARYTVERGPRGWRVIQVETRWII